MEDALIHQILNKKNQPIGWVLLFRSLAPLRASALEPVARRARVVRPGPSQTIGLGSSVLTLLSHGEPHVRNTTPEKTNPRVLSYSGFSF